MTYIQTNDSLQGIKGAVKLTFRNVKTGEEEVYHIINTFVTAGKASIAQRLGLQTSTSAIITYMATGTGGGTPAIGNTTMFTELFRKAISVVSVNSNVVTFTTYYSTTESNGVLTEIGLFGDLATATLNTGTMYAHTNITKTKTSSDTLTIEWSLTIN